MAKKKKQKKVVKNKFSNEIGYLNKLKELSLKNIDGKSPELDSLFQNQVKRLSLKIEKLEENQ